jgi:hypothetical protein
MKPLLMQSSTSPSYVFPLSSTRYPRHPITKHLHSINVFPRYGKPGTISLQNILQYGMKIKCLMLTASGIVIQRQILFCQISVREIGVTNGTCITQDNLYNTLRCVNFIAYIFRFGLFN